MRTLITFLLISYSTLVLAKDYSGLLFNRDISLTSKGLTTGTSIARQNLGKYSFDLENSKKQVLKNNISMKDPIPGNERPSAYSLVVQRGENKNIERVTEIDDKGIFSNQASYYTVTTKLSGSGQIESRTKCSGRLLSNIIQRDGDMSCFTITPSRCERLKAKWDVSGNHTIPMAEITKNAEKCIDVMKSIKPFTDEVYSDSNYEKYEVENIEIIKNNLPRSKLLNSEKYSSLYKSKDKRKAVISYFQELIDMTNECTRLEKWLKSDSTKVIRSKAKGISASKEGI